jgi:hypothetical protein
VRDAAAILQSDQRRKIDKIKLSKMLMMMHVTMGK